LPIILFAVADMQDGNLFFINGIENTPSCGFTIQQMADFYFEFA
jgi:glutaredoxin-related protein